MILEENIDHLLGCSDPEFHQVTHISSVSSLTTECNVMSLCCKEQYAGNYDMLFCPVILDKPGLLFNMNYFLYYSRGQLSAPLPMPAGAHEWDLC